MSERLRPEPSITQKVEADNQNAEKGPLEGKATAEKVAVEQESYTPDEKMHAENRTYEVQDRISEAKSRNADRSALEKIRSFLTGKGKVTEKGIAMEQAEEEDKEFTRNKESIKGVSTVKTEKSETDKSEVLKDLRQKIKDLEEELKSMRDLSEGIRNSVINLEHEQHKTSEAGMPKLYERIDHARYREKEHIRKMHELMDELGRLRAERDNITTETGSVKE